MPTNGSAGPGLVFRSTPTDDGQNFTAALTPAGVTTANVWLKYFPGLNELYAYVSQITGSATSPEAVYLSTDQGQSWAPVFTQATSATMLPTRGDELDGEDAGDASYRNAAAQHDEYKLHT